MPRKRDLVSLQPVPFEEAVSDILKVKPPPEKKRRRGKKQRKKQQSTYGGAFAPAPQNGSKPWSVGL
jgi:hypothetical protein